MHSYFTRERFGRPQFLAGLLLLVFLAQAVWLVRMEFDVKGEAPPQGPEDARMMAGWQQWHGEGIAGAPYADPQAAPCQPGKAGICRA